MRYRLGRVLQFIGLVILPCAISLNLAGKGSVGMTLVIAGAGAAIFYLGWLLQRGSQP